MATIKKRNDSYLITVSLGADYKGKKIRRYTTWEPPENMSEKRQEKEVERIANEFEAKCRMGDVVDGNVRFCDFADKWFKDCAEKQLRPYTLNHYHSLMPRINQAIGHVKLKDLRPHHLVEFYNNLGEKGIRLDIKYRCLIDFNSLLTEKKIKKTTFAEKSKVSISTLKSLCHGNNVSKETAEKISKAMKIDMNKLFELNEGKATLSGQTIQHHHRLISTILSTAVEWEAISSNPCQRVKPPKVAPSAPRYLDEVEAVQLLAAISHEEPKYRMITTLLLLTGMRRGEAMGLEWKDINFEQSVINIVRTSQYISGQGIITDETKNESSKRAIKSPNSLLVDLRKYRLWQNEERLKIGDQWENHDRLFTQWNGKPMNPDTFSQWFHDFVERKGLPDIVAHSLRHTNATLQIANGVPITTVAGGLAHATPATTTKIYSHEIKSADAAAPEVLENILTPNQSMTKSYFSAGGRQTDGKIHKM
ncbi:MAG: tyrosine-type recombinase/integrase [Clostridiales bacterium]